MTARPYDWRADSYGCWRIGIAFARRVHELRTMYGLHPTQARRLARRQMCGEVRS